MNNAYGLNSYGYCKGIDKVTGKEVRGYYAVLPYTTYCVKEDYDAHPDNDRESIISTSMMDWGLPNHLVQTVIVPGSMKRFIGLDKHGNEVFENDKVCFDIGGLTLTTFLYYGDWESQVCSHFEDENGQKTYPLSMWNKERQLWLWEGELVKENEEQ